MKGTGQSCPKCASRRAKPLGCVSETISAVLGITGVVGLFFFGKDLIVTLLEVVFSEPGWLAVISVLALYFFLKSIVDEMMARGSGKVMACPDCKHTWKNRPRYVQRSVFVRVFRA